MAKYASVVGLVVLVALVGAGCGGGGGGKEPGAPPPGQQAGTVWSQGGLRVEAEQAGLQTVVLGPPGMGVGFYGATIKRLEYRPVAGRITYWRWVSGTAQIFVAQPDGSREKQLTSGAPNKFMPRFSPDGTRIVYYSPSGLYIMNADGSGNHLVQNFTTTSDSTPCWDPAEGKYLVYRGVLGGQWDLWKMRADGQSPVRLTNTGPIESYPDWSPDGSRIVYSREDGDTEIWVMRADGSNQTQLTDNSAADICPRWSPDGGSIVFCSYRDGNPEIYKMDPDGSNQTRLTNDSASDNYPTWSPDGSRIIWCRDDDLWEMSPDGSNQHLVKADLGYSPDWWGPRGQRWRVFIGPLGSDFGGSNPPFNQQRTCALVTSGPSGLGSAVTCGSTGTLPTITPLNSGLFLTAIPLMAELRAGGIIRVIEDNGPGVLPSLYDMPTQDGAYPQVVLLVFDSDSGRLQEVVPLTAQVSAAAAGAGPVRVEKRAGQVVIYAPIAAVFAADNPRRNLAPGGARSLTVAARSAKLVAIQ
jgi:WD40 repeat protein